MIIFKRNNHSVPEPCDLRRREFIRNGVMLGTLTGIAGLSLVTGCKEEDGENISPAEDLMREHGVLDRIMLIYEACRLHLLNGEQFPGDILSNSASIVKGFIEDYHEKLEEDFLFPRFEKANHLIDIVRVLRNQHTTGRRITGQIINSGGVSAQSAPDENQKLIRLIDEFNRMYRPHKAREDTVLFPELRKIIPSQEYFALGEDFEKKEHELFGEDGFEAMVVKVEGIEKQLEIYELSEFTPDMV